MKESMVCTISPVLPTLSPRAVRNARLILCQAQSSKCQRAHPADLPLRTRRQTLLFFGATAAASVTGKGSQSMAEDIPLFGLRKKLKKAEEEAVEIVREGFEAAEKGIEGAERGIVAAERGIEAAEKEIETAVSFNALAQAGVVAGAEFLGVLVATSVVNGILGPEGQNP